MPVMVDAATVLMAHNTYSSSQSFSPIAVYPRQLPTCCVTIHLLTPPAASCTFTIEIASTATGTYAPIAIYTWRRCQ